ncbi:MAG: (2R)-3-sulfolactate dehydrogenase (NADP+), partial [Cellvibrionaceae bacterium]
MATLTLPEIYQLSYDALTRCGAADIQAAPGAKSIQDAEADGIRNVGLNYLPIYLGHLLHNKLAGNAVPQIVKQEGSVIQVNAAHGFSHTAFLHVLEPFSAMVRQQGVGIMSIQNGYTAGVVGWFSNILAREGFLNFGFANAPSSVHPAGGKKKFFGTNPLGFGSPRAGQPPIIVDLATSMTAKVNVKQAAYEGREIPLGWAQDIDGNPTTDAAEGLAGSLSPLGGAKGYGLGLMVELMAAGLTGGNWAFEAPQFGNNEGGYPDVGQTFIAIDPAKTGGEAYLERVEHMLGALLEQDGVRLPGGRRAEFRATAEANGIVVPDALIEKI